MKKLKLFCLPYAGGMSTIFNRWNYYLDEKIELFPLEYRGRGRRSSECLYSSIADAVEDIVNFISKEMDYEQPYAFYGHSMGSLVFYEIAHVIKNRGFAEAKHIFFSGRKPPNLGDWNEPIYKLPEKDFIAKILEFEGTPKEVFENMELKNIFLPILRADFKAVNEYVYFNREDKLISDLSILYGQGDKDITEEEAIAWKAHTDGSVDIFKFKGGHFYIHEEFKEMIQVINTQLNKFI